MNRVYILWILVLLGVVNTYSQNNSFIKSELILNNFKAINENPNSSNANFFYQEAMIAYYEGLKEVFKMNDVSSIFKEIENYKIGINKMSRRKSRMLNNTFNEKFYEDVYWQCVYLRKINDAEMFRLHREVFYFTNENDSEHCNCGKCHQD